MRWRVAASLHTRWIFMAALLLVLAHRKGLALRQVYEVVLLPMNTESTWRSLIVGRLHTLILDHPVSPSPAVRSAN